MNDPILQTFEEIVKGRMAAKGLTVHDIIRESGIPETFVGALVNGDFHKLPAAPYTRGYIRSLAEFLDLNDRDLWERYVNEHLPRRSGPNDQLPQNRFALAPARSRRWIFSGLLVLALLAFLILRGSRFFGRPELTITFPADETITVTTSPLLLIGAIDPNDSLLINGESVEVLPTGEFTYQFFLEPGLNTVVFTARRFLGREAEEVRHIFFEALAPVTSENDD